MRKLLLPLFGASLLGLSACQPSPELIEFAGAVQGTTYHIKVVQEERAAEIAPLRTEIDQTFQTIDLKLSNYREDSEISRLNQDKSTDWIPVSPEIAELTQIAKQVYERTQGCYDLTIKPLFNLWGFSRHENRVPTPEEIHQALAHVGMNRLDIDRAHSRIRKQDPELRIDLSSIAQGYTVGAIAQVLERHGFQNYLVEVGGEMKVKGHKPDGRSWRVAIEKPTPATREVQRVLDIYQEAGTAIMTAGTYRNFFEDRGQVYSHILDPHTGRPVTHHLLSVTVLHDDPTWADAWDTALLCLGETEAARLAEAEHLKAVLIYAQGQTLQEYLSPAFMRAQTAPEETSKHPAAEPVTPHSQSFP